MGDTTTPQVTEADRERAERFVMNYPSVTEAWGDEMVGFIATELAASRREGEIAEHRKVCRYCEYYEAVPEDATSKGLYECSRIKQLIEGR